MENIFPSSTEGAKKLFFRAFCIFFGVIPWNGVEKSGMYAILIHRPGPVWNRSLPQFSTTFPENFTGTAKKVNTHVQILLTASFFGECALR